MENWHLDKVIRMGRVAMWIFIIAFSTPFLEGALISFQDNPQMVLSYEEQRKYEKLSFITDVSSIILIPAATFALVYAAEASGRTRSNRITIGEINRKFTEEEIKKAAKYYSRNPLTFPWHHILMVPQWIVAFHLKNGWVGMPKILLENRANLEKRN